MHPLRASLRAPWRAGFVAFPGAGFGARDDFFASPVAQPPGWRGRLALAVFVSVLLHVLLLAQHDFRLLESEAPYRFSVLLREATHQRAPLAEPPVPARPEPSPRSNTPARPALSNRTRAAPPLSRPEVKPEVAAPPPSPPPSGRELAADAVASMQGLTREMDSQARRLDPKRDHLREPAVSTTPRSPLAIALEKRFGRPMHFREESVEPQPDGSTLYRLKTEIGAICIRSFQPNVLLSAPGQGPGHMAMVPMYCP